MAGLRRLYSRESLTNDCIAEEMRFNDWNWYSMDWSSRAPRYHQKENQLLASADRNNAVTRNTASGLLLIIGGHCSHRVWSGQGFFGKALGPQGKLAGGC